MTEEEKKIEQKIMPWRFWLLVILSAFLIVTFASYLPLHFQQSAMNQSHMGVSNESINVRDGVSVDVALSPATPLVNEVAKIDFFVNIKPSSTPVPYTSLELDHTKLMHVIGVRSDMESFFHVHPHPDVASPGHFSVRGLFALPGNYKMWAQVATGSVVHTIGLPPFEVQGEGPREAKKVDYSRRMNIDGYVATFNAPEKIAKGRDISFAIDVHDSKGNEIRLEEYLAVQMHLAAIKDDWTQFMHTHPSGGGTMMHAELPIRFINDAYADGMHSQVGPSLYHGTPFLINFPTAGVYRVFAQFRPLGTDLPPEGALTAMFWVRVDETAPSIPTVDLKKSWWILLVASVVLIAVLSRIVKKYIGE
jgi:hypothetical protein